MRHLIHKVICWYLRRCGGAFHCYPYGERGRYVVLMDEQQYAEYNHRFVVIDERDKYRRLLSEWHATHDGLTKKVKACP